MDNDELIEDMMETLESDRPDHIKRALLRTSILEAGKMTEGDNETLPVMTPAEFEAFINAEDEALKEARGEVPVMEQIEGK